MQLWATEDNIKMKNAVFWDVTPCGSYKSKRFGGMYSTFGSVLQLLVTANVVVTSPIFVSLMKAIRSSETSVLTRATGDGIIYSHRRENLNSNIALTGWAL
jgi:uncharacterized BrkB/YihY/UPF0761 family membrane protein